MRVDLYTKLVLTVIAGCLLFLVVKSGFSPSEATAGGSQSVWVDGGSIDINSSYRWPVYVRVVNWP